MEVKREQIQYLQAASMAAYGGEDQPLGMVVFRPGIVAAGDGRWQYQADFDVPKEWEFGVKASLLQSALKSLQMFPWHFNYKDAQLHMSDSVGTNISIQTSSLDRYPAPQTAPQGSCAQVWQAAEFHEYAATVSYAAAADDARVALGCVAISPKGMKATDGYRLAQVGVVDKKVESEPLLMPASALKLISGWEGEIKLYSENGVLTAVSDNAQLKMSGLPSHYPDISLDTPQMQAEIERDELVTLLKSAQMFKQQPGLLHIQGGSLHIRVQGPSQGIMRKQLALESMQQTGKAMLNLGYVREAASHLHSASMNMALNQDEACCLWQDDSKHWIMPYKGRG